MGLKGARSDPAEGGRLRRGRQRFANRGGERDGKEEETGGMYTMYRRAVLDRMRALV